MCGHKSVCDFESSHSQCEWQHPDSDNVINFKNKFIKELGILYLPSFRIMRMWLLKVKLIKKFSLLTKQTVSATIFFLLLWQKSWPKQLKRSETYLAYILVIKRWRTSKVPVRTTFFYSQKAERTNQETNRNRLCTLQSCAGDPLAIARLNFLHGSQASPATPPTEDQVPPHSISHSNPILSLVTNSARALLWRKVPLLQPRWYI